MLVDVPDAHTLHHLSRFQTIFACAPECVKLIDPDGRLIDINPAGLRMIDAPNLDAVRGRNVLDLVDPAHRAAVAEALRQVFEGQSVRLQFEVVGLSGRRLWMDQSAAPLFDPADATCVKEMVAITRDITAERRAESQLLHAKVADAITKSKSAFILGLGNDLKTPLHQIVGYAELLQEAASEQERSGDVDDLQRILDASRRLLSMISQLVIAAREDADGDRGAAPCDFVELVEDAIEAARPIAEANGNRLALDIPSAPQLWHGDKHQLDLCLRSLFSHASAFARGGLITVRLRPERDSHNAPWLRLLILETGARIENANLVAAFCAAPGLSPVQRDLGQFWMDLAVAREVVGMMGGTLDADASGSKGAVLRLKLPLSAPSLSHGA